MTKQVMILGNRKDTSRNSQYCEVDQGAALTLPAPRSTVISVLSLEEEHKGEHKPIELKPISFLR